MNLQTNSTISLTQQENCFHVKRHLCNKLPTDIYLDYSHILTKTTHRYLPRSQILNSVTSSKKLNTTHRYLPRIWLWTDGKTEGQKDGRTDNAKILSLRLWRGITSYSQILTYIRDLSSQILNSSQRLNSVTSSKKLNSCNKHIYCNKLPTDIYLESET
ncbi:hypothetical protein DPMN_153032 [Dreissena polymorpha]|uniref:Uncharacterized protein n=1 Tax=Dreissena polymorpha TaxID=45954 RepID=A0A9D4FKQ5_DREPO|nr:hypothetical protein DPMN_153032 [Dreissena polymorpha]